MNDEVIPIDVMLNSEYSAEGTPDAPVFIFGSDALSLTNIVGYSFIGAVVPFTFYNVDATCNQFAIITYSDQNVVTNNELIVIPTGSYTITTLLDELEKLTAHITTFHWSVVSQSGQLRVESASVNKFLLDFTQANSCNEILGFRKDDVIMTTNKVLVSPNVVKLNGYNNLHVYSKELGGLVGKAFRSQDTGIIGTLPIAGSFGSLLTYEAQDPMMVPLPSFQLNRLDLSLRLGNRKRYANSTIPYVPKVPLLPVSSINETDHIRLNGHGFTIKLRFYQKQTQGRTLSNGNIVRHVG